MNQIIGDMVNEIKNELGNPFSKSFNFEMAKLLEIISIQQEIIEGLVKSRDEINSKLRGLVVTHTRLGGGYQPSKDLDLIGKELPSGDTDVIPPKTRPIIPITCGICTDGKPF